MQPFPNHGQLHALDFPLNMKLQQELCYYSEILKSQMDSYRTQLPTRLIIALLFVMHCVVLKSLP